MKSARIILSACAMLVAIIGAFATKVESTLANVYTKGSGMCVVSATCTSGPGISCSSTAFANLSDCQANQNAVQAHKN